MNRNSFILAILCFFVSLTSCSGQTKQILNENELSVLLFNDTISYYNGILDKDIKVTTLPYDTITIKKLIKQNKEKYADRLRILIKLANEYKVFENAVKLVEIAREQEVFATVFPLTKTDKSFFKVEDFSWEPQHLLETQAPKPVSISLFMPKDESDKIETKPTDSVLTLLLLKNNILAYKGDKMLEATTYEYKTIRQELVKDSRKFGDNFFVIIKPSAESSSRNTVDILDEMAICNIKRYAMADLIPEEIELIKKFNSITER